MKKTVCGAIFTVGFMFLLFAQHGLFAGELERNIFLTISFEGFPQKNSLPLVSVGGQVAGVIPGTIKVPISEKGTPVEIGFLQLRQIPLYSFVLGPKEIESLSINVISSSFEIEKDKNLKAWSQVVLKPNNETNVRLESIGEDSYSLVLPVKPYETMQGFWKSAEITPYSADWISDIEPQNNKSAEFGVDHLVYSPKQHNFTRLTTMKDPMWSGAASLGSPWHFLPKEKWAIQSEPMGAEIYTDSGDGVQGLTPAVLDLKITRSLFVIINKVGYVQSVYAPSHPEISKHCKKISAKDGAKLSCILLKAKTKAP